MKRLYEKSELWFALLWIIGYCVLASVGDALSDQIGTDKIMTLPILILLSFVAFLFLRKNRMLEQYGFCKSKVSMSSLLYYIPLFILLTANLWFGVEMKTSAGEAVCYILSMLCVGFLEELIFRGFLFHAMAKDSLKAAIIVSSVTFGMGHIINLVNGSGAELLPNLLQVVYAMAAGFMFVMVYYRSKSLLPCILTHGLFNALSIFSNDALLTTEQSILSCILLSVISGGYAAYLAFSQKETSKS